MSAIHSVYFNIINNARQQMLNHSHLF